MPASPALVSLDHAKDWAKRLQKAVPSLSGLAQAQEAVALMLGHAHWHALTSFYAPVPIPEKAETEGDYEALYQSVISNRHPELGDVRVEVMAYEMTELREDGADGLIARAKELENDGYFQEDALAMALEENTVTSHAPPGHMLVRVRDPSDKAFWLCLSQQDLAPTKRPQDNAPAPVLSRGTRRRR